MSELSSLGVLVPPKTRHIEEEVVPWLMDKIVDFLREDDAAISGSTNIVDSGINEAQN